MKYISRAIAVTSLICAAAAVLPATAQTTDASTTPAAPQRSRLPAVQSATKGDPTRKDGTLLPGGASSLQEGFGDWTVACVLPDGRKTCSLSQTQADPQTKQRVLAMEVTIGTDGAPTGILVMPFGLDLNKGVSFKVGDAGQPTTLPFQTCVPAGCVVQLKLDGAMLESLRAAKQIALSAQAVDSTQKLDLSISMKGFDAGLARVKALAQGS